ncbi:PAS-domain containing protein [Azohydromonas caseinilytica]|uniref:histidine kinase n=1 Tax=Azohydromonas caseinilytica TaxID=2728836 RepID=A0A848FG16_9BURK|nr:PAS-domain containing protein [Azohydromonas caseinilytica]NML17259.1 PAS domain-containing protein [Azohydromonas caseinilytica]
MVAPLETADERLKHHASLQAALDLIDQGFSLIDGELRLLAWNQAFTRLLDFPAELVHAGASFEDFIRFNAARGEYGPGDVEAQVAERVAMARRLEPHEFERVRPNGQVLRVRGVPVPGIGFITLYSDITAQKRAEAQALEQAAELERRVAERTSELRLSEAQMRLITDSLPALIAYFDAKKAYRYINRGYREWFGLDPARLDQISAREYLGRETYASIRPNVARAFAGEPVSYEYEAHCVDGRVRMARTTLIPEKAADGTVIGCFELTFDVSELRRAQELLSQAQKMEALGQLTGGLAHDFNNMLTVIIGNLGALRELRDDEAVTEFIDPALAAARRGAELIRALLGFARRQPLEAQAAEVGPLVGTVINLLRRSLPEGLELQADSGELPLWAWVDASHLQDALVNLVLNSRDAQATRVSVSVRADTLSAARAYELQAKPGHYIRIDVRDDGHGMDAATRSRVFEPFFTTKRPGAGTGLGMSMVYGFVRQSEGAIAIDSAPGAGTTVSLWLPVAQSAVASLLADSCCDAGHRADPPMALALLVEDDAEVRKVVRRALLDLGFAVLEAENGAEALQILEHAPRIELLLSDVVMPGGVDGREVARQALSRGVPRVALMSGFVPGEQPAAGEVPMLCKPFTKRQLADFLARQVPALSSAPRALGAAHG